MWPTDAASLVAVQQGLASARPDGWHPTRDPLVAACWVCFPRGLTGRGGPGDAAWAAVVLMRAGVVVGRAVRRDVAGTEYQPGLLALRLGPAMERAVKEAARPDVLLVDATSVDHPRRAGLALHLGFVLDVPTIGVTHRPLLARGAWPADRAGAVSPLKIDDEVVACWLRTRAGARPLVVHPGWQLELDTAVEVVATVTGRRRTPEPLRRARQLARRARESDRRSAGD